jgi:hypothetical protein
MEFLKIDLSEDEITWLQEAWRVLRTSGKKPNFQTIRLHLMNKTKQGFSPMSINQKAVEESATLITLMGVLNVESDTSILKDADRIVHLIRGKLIENSGREMTFTTHDIGSELVFDEQYVRVVIHLLRLYFGFYNNASPPPEADDFGYNRFTINDPTTFEQYFTFTGFEIIIAEWYKRYLKDEERYVKRQPEKPINLEVQLSGNKDFFVHPTRINELSMVATEKFDLSKLLALCRELNINYSFGCHYSIALLIRSILNHVSPIFGYGKFADVLTKYQADGNIKSFRQSIVHLEESSRKIADSYAHSLVRAKETLPTETQIDFRRDLDVLLGEIVRILKS